MRYSELLGQILLAAEERLGIVATPQVASAGAPGGATYAPPPGGHTRGERNEVPQPLS
jgi:hypothetical protein